MLSCIFILDENLEPLISKNIRAIPNFKSIVELFRKHRSTNTTELPIVSINDWNFIQIKRDSLIFLGAININDYMSDLMSMSIYLDKFYYLLKMHLKTDTLNRNIILDNILLIMELIDESIDFGIIQMTDPNIIKDYVRVKVNLPDEDISLSINKNQSSLDRDNERQTSNNYSISTDSAHYSNDLFNEHYKYSKYLSNEDDESEDSEKETEERKKKKKENLQHKKYIKKQQKLAKSMLQTITNPDVSKILELRKHVNILNKEDMKLVDAENDENYINSYIAKTTIMPISWRTKGIYYAKNEFFLDVLEKQEYIMDFKNDLIRKNLIQGKIICRCFLSGMPKLKIALNKLLQKDQQFLSQLRFHQCVSLETIQNKEIEFIPPDGEFILCEYELKRHVKDPPNIKLISFEIKPKLKKFKIQINLSITTFFKVQNSTSILNLKIPLEKLFNDYKIDLKKSPRFKSNIGQVKFNLSDDFLLWEIGSMKGGHGENIKAMTAEFFLFNEEEYLQLQEELKTSMNPPPLRVGPKLEELYEQLHEPKTLKEEGEQDINTGISNHKLDTNDNGSIPSTGTTNAGANIATPASTSVVKNDTSSNKEIPLKKALSNKPQYLTVDFEIPYYACSGLKVEYLKIEEEQLLYQSFPWVRYKTTNDKDYVFVV
ncbi:hypothetical protein TBLA_0B06760 [Henningerozyma blattae CBS 6284]|uniref:MHD domain-containing protein n=1 Tax=Henningerozyma blattae (strain ATCC 34711 / CBS 6284 / DSM 70876 / NBRC 10599 / NRRL Y-10934 / UCD 77-7) TaxID=1071380 RepID=I2GZE6_HENB6|nr:hypothetical protein TBLA_0B06760 [Tetrapisispora blattae CBS 6284]CCH59498.1 hypothetical protein TBLA_0B06760 [Tetrapisispora blattae CBS 6284]